VVCVYVINRKLRLVRPTILRVVCSSLSVHKVKQLLDINKNKGCGGLIMLLFFSSPLGTSNS